MTVSYTNKLSTSRLSGLARVLFLWKASVYKAIWKETILFMILFYTVGTLFKFLDEPYQKHFKLIIAHFHAGSTLIPVTFVLGFFIDKVAKRWWDIYKKVLWPDSLTRNVPIRALPLVDVNHLAVKTKSNEIHSIHLYTPELLYKKLMLKVACMVEGDNEESQMIRRTLARYINLSSVLVLRDISIRVKMRFPSLHHLVIAGLMTEEEMEEFKHVTKTHKLVYMSFLPIQWSVNLAYKARKAEYIKTDQLLKHVVKEIVDVKDQLNLISCYDWVNLPLVYTQVVTIAVYSFFFTYLISGQVVEIELGNGNKETITSMIPLFSLIDFLFYMGLLKVAQAMINPFGADDDDFELNYIIDRNVQVSYLIVDTCRGKLPVVTTDCTSTFDSKDLDSLKDKFVPSASLIDIPEEMQRIVVEPPEERPWTPLSFFRSSSLLSNGSVFGRHSNGWNSDSTFRRRFRSANSFHLYGSQRPRRKRKFKNRHLSLG
ncbi:Bestrophin-1 [Trichinella zimbabwensis]|uniref:Bestrophin homolog n=1 Tax=Trichinella zimbabwensis TaxID=268475 RepID=A0A0V1HZ41_9BILA|nr:Bestrophin-1 [Trichinella zimbabwensis]